jgi:hypothetical protein
VRSPDAATEKWPMAIAFGGGLALSGHPTGEATFLPDIAGPHVSIGCSGTGADRRAYVEGGVGLLLSLAAGAGYHFDPEIGSHWGFHAFVGLPIPVVGWGPDGSSTPFTASVRIAPLLLYLEPYYRPELREGAAVEHEVGVLIKFRVALTSHQWSLPGYNLITAGMHEL